MFLVSRPLTHYKAIALQAYASVLLQSSHDIMPRYNITNTYLGTLSKLEGLNADQDIRPTFLHPLCH